MSKRDNICKFLIPFGWIFGNIARLRRWLYRQNILESFHPSVPAVCVGNLAVGGTGKTPHTGYVVQQLSKHFKVAVLSRGYGRKSTGFVLANAIAYDQCSAEMIGDEPLLLHQHFPDVPLAVHGNRRDGVLQLLTHYPEIDVVVLDDAYQHLSFSPTLKMILTEYSNPYFNDYPMPAGRLREFPSAVQDADVVIVTKTDARPEDVPVAEWRRQLGLKTHQALFFTRYAYGQPKPVTELAYNFTISAHTEVLLLSGIAHPEPLKNYVEHTFQLYKHLDFPDHHSYNLQELHQVQSLLALHEHPNRVILTTEKDWMRLQNENIKKVVSLLPIFIIPIEVEFLFDNDKFNKIIDSHVRREKKEN